VARFPTLQALITYPQQAGFQSALQSLEARIANEIARVEAKVG